MIYIRGCVGFFIHVDSILVVGDLFAVLGNRRIPHFELYDGSTNGDKGPK